MLSRIQYWQLLSTYYAPGSVQDLEYKSQQNPLCLQGSQSHIQEGHFLKWRKIHLRHTHTHTCRLTHSGQLPECDHCPLDILIFKKKPAHHKHRTSPWRSECVVLLLCFVTAGSDLSSVDPCIYPVPCLPLSRTAVAPHGTPLCLPRCLQPRAVGGELVLSTFIYFADSIFSFLSLPRREIMPPPPSPSRTVDGDFFSPQQESAPR